ncbi:unnamed protein product, partial [Brachionus calyciflorus]
VQPGICVNLTSVAVGQALRFKNKLVSQNDDDESDEIVSSKENSDIEQDQILAKLDNYNFIFGPVFNNNHWTLMFVNLKNCSVLYIDPFGASKETNDMWLSKARNDLKNLDWRKKEIENSKQSSNDTINYEEFRRHFLNKNYETQKPYEAMIFDDLEVDEDDEVGENQDQFYTKESNEADKNLESLFSLRQEIPLIIQNLANDYKRLTQCQKGVIDFIESQGQINQFLTFIFGPAGT